MQGYFKISSKSHQPWRVTYMTGYVVTCYSGGLKITVQRVLWKI